MAQETGRQAGVRLESDLRLIREARGLTRDDVYNRTRIRPEVLQAVEENGFDGARSLSSDIHRRSFMKHVAEAIGVSFDDALQALDEASKGAYSGFLSEKYLGADGDPDTPRWAVPASIPKKTVVEDTEVPESRKHEESGLSEPEAEESDSDPAPVSDPDPIPIPEVEDRSDDRFRPEILRPPVMHAPIPDSIDEEPVESVTEHIVEAISEDIIESVAEEATVPPPEKVVAPPAEAVVASVVDKVAERVTPPRPVVHPGPKAVDEKSASDINDVVEKPRSASRNADWREVPRRRPGWLFPALAIALVAVLAFLWWWSPRAEGVPPVEAVRQDESPSQIGLGSLPEQLSGFIRFDDETEQFVTVRIDSMLQVPDQFAYTMWTRMGDAIYPTHGVGQLYTNESRVRFADPYGWGATFDRADGSVVLRSWPDSQYPKWELSGD